MWDSNWNFHNIQVNCCMHHITKYMGKKEGIIGFWNQIGYGACIGDHTGHFIAATADYEVAALDVKDVLHHYPLFSVKFVRRARNSITLPHAYTFSLAPYCL
ncbi:hypothetical protein VNO78_36409 [Psophocarpus tetragonolobus]|uniref:Uncharacterized protein n=1 Tax=Psophocarpus tetragonolobus TaxID=3891 RepID=A0AAN9NEQ7_PSOTE